MSLLSTDHLKKLVEQSQAPCISLYMPAYQAGPEIRQNPIRFKNLVSKAEAMLQEQYNLHADDVSATLKSIQELDQAEFWQHQNKGLAVFSAPGFFQSYRLPLGFNEDVIVSDRFYLKPLMPLLSGDGVFYLLALSQKQIRFFEGSRYGIREVELEGVPNNMNEALSYDETAQTGQFRISTSKGGTNNSFQKAGNVHGQGSPDRDQHKNHDILQFFYQIDHGLQKYLHDKQAPLLLAGVEYLLPLYQEANTYQNLVNEIIPVENVGVLEPNEALHEQAWAVVEPYHMQAQQNAVELYHDLTGTERASTDLKETIAAAYYGRVDRLFVPVGVQRWGNFDPQANELHLHEEAEPGDEELLNAAAVQTILNSGTVYAVEPEEVPDQALVAAILRY
ncbi:MAG: hypothetical protein Kow00121_60500 [Elainellaceae cyanobacterium]